MFKLQGVGFRKGIEGSHSSGTSIVYSFRIIQDSA